MNKEELIKAYKDKVLNSDGKSKLIDMFLYGEDTYDKDVVEAMESTHKRGTKWEKKMNYLNY